MPGATKQFAATQTFSLIVIGALINSKFLESYRWLAVHKKEFWLIIEF